MKKKMAKAISQGFSLVEMMVALALLAILLSLSAPVIDLIEEQRVHYQAKRIINSFNLARSEAIKRNRSVAICSADTPTTCGDLSQWDNGAIFWLDDNANTDIDPGEEITRYFAIEPGRQVIFFGDPPSSISATGQVKY